MSKQEKIRIRLKGYDHKAVDQSAAKIAETAKRTGSRVSGPIPLPTERNVYTILRSPHVNKDSREQFEMRIHKRLIDILDPSKIALDIFAPPYSLISMLTPAGSSSLISASAVFLEGSRMSMSLL